MRRTTANTSKPSVLVLVRPSLYAELFTPEAEQRLRAIAAVTLNTEERRWTSDKLATHVPGFDAVITGWGTPTFTDAVLEAADSLRLIAHSAGSIKQLLPPAVFERDIQVTHAAAAIALAVAETSLLFALLCLRPVHRYDRMVKAGAPWAAIRENPMPRELAGQRVGLIGASYTGRRFIALLRALECEVWVADPYLSDLRAAELGVTRRSLDEVMAGCSIVSVHAPVTDETSRMIGARELALLPDGAAFINTARSQVVDQHALLAELSSGRIQAALDVFDEEPLPLDSPFRTLPNAIITPHVAGTSQQARRRQGEIVVAELERFCSRQPLHYPVTLAMLATMA